MTPPPKKRTHFLLRNPSARPPPLSLFGPHRRMARAQKRCHFHFRCESGSIRCSAVTFPLSEPLTGPATRLLLSLLSARVHGGPRGTTTTLVVACFRPKGAPIYAFRQQSGRDHPAVPSLPTSQRLTACPSPRPSLSLRPGNRPSVGRREALFTSALRRGRGSDGTLGRKVKVMHSPMRATVEL